MKKENFLIKNWKLNWKFLKESKWYILFALAIFCFFILIGFTFPVFFREQIIAYLKELTGRFDGLGVFETIIYILWNNARASFFAVLLGVLFGIFPVAAAVTNGYLIGFVSRYAVEEYGIFVLWRLLPHGIFELPAIIISIGIGLKLGLDFLLKDKRKQFKKDFKEAMRFFLFSIIPLLVVAAIIEGILVVFAG